jgi:hypothetical protein
MPRACRSTPSLDAGAEDGFAILTTSSHWFRLSCGQGARDHRNPPATFCAGLVGCETPRRAEPASAAFFTVPVEGAVLLTPMGGEAAGVTVFGFVTSSGDLVDLLIATAATLDDAPLVTRNVEDFARVPGLRLIDY